jgi:hypothetical protein
MSSDWYFDDLDVVRHGSLPYTNVRLGRTTSGQGIARHHTRAREPSQPKVTFRVVATSRSATELSIGAAVE